MTKANTHIPSAASALAANSILRSLAGAGFPLFATYMVRTHRSQHHKKKKLNY